MWQGRNGENLPAKGELSAAGPARPVTHFKKRGDDMKAKLEPGLGAGRLTNWKRGLAVILLGGPGTPTGIG